MSEHSDNIRRRARHRSGNCPQCTRLLAAADYLDALEQQRDVLLAACKAYEQWEADLLRCDAAWQDSLPRFTQELYDKWMQIQPQRNAAVRACEKTTAGCGAKACDDPPDLTRDNQSASQQL